METTFKTTDQIGLNNWINNDYAFIKTEDNKTLLVMHNDKFCNTSLDLMTVLNLKPDFIVCCYPGSLKGLLPEFNIIFEKWNSVIYAYTRKDENGLLDGFIVSTEKIENAFIMNME